MKKLLTSVLLLVLTAPAVIAQADVTAPGAAAPDPNAPVITFESETIDYGTLNQGSDAVRTFKFTNTGKTPLLIQSIKGQCGCTSIPDSWPKDPIAPGGSGTFQVKYDTTTRVGAFDKKVTVTSNASNSPKDVKIKGVVVAAMPGGASKTGGN
ncbi:MAG: hypothetical protein FD123_3677 [Bacteroidetes bacterium]|nr:MAG: hypothetical protein FD123_3677 [Bacteroidota bacterium]